MFNWLKNKLNNLIPSDLNKGFLTSNYVTVKVGDKITIPENVVCFVSFHDKVYTELKSGSHCFDKDLIPVLFQKQKKNKKKLKKLNLDLFFINLNKQLLKTTYLDKIPIMRQSSKLRFEIETTINVVEIKTFYKFICAEFYQPMASTTNEFISEIIEEFVRRLFRKISLESTTIPQNITNDINEKLKKHLNKIGLDLTSFSITTFNLKHSLKKDLEEKNNSVLPENLLVENKNDTNILDQHKEIDYNQTNAIQQNCNACSNCGSKIIKGSLFCHRCGHYL